MIIAATAAIGLIVGYLVGRYVHWRGEPIRPPQG